MGKILIDEQTFPTTPAAGKSVLWPDSSLSKLCYKDDGGRGYILGGGISNAANASQALAAADTYITDSDLQVPSFLLQTRTRFRWVLEVSKTAAGVAGPIYQIRMGGARTTADTSRCSVTGPAQTGAIDTAFIEIIATLRNAGGSATLRTIVKLIHNLSGVTGFANVVTPVVAATGGTFNSDSVTAGQFVGLSINAGASAAWTVEQVHAIMDF